MHHLVMRFLRLSYCLNEAKLALCFVPYNTREWEALGSLEYYSQSSIFRDIVKRKVTERRNTDEVGPF
jgi:hypothetical protein